MNALRARLRNAQGVRGDRRAAARGRPPSPVGIDAAPAWPARSPTSSPASTTRSTPSSPVTRTGPYVCLLANTSRSTPPGHQRVRPSAGLVTDIDLTLDRHRRQVHEATVTADNLAVRARNRRRADIPQLIADTTCSRPRCANRLDRPDHRHHQHGAPTSRVRTRSGTSSPTPSWRPPTPPISATREIAFMNPGGVRDPGSCSTSRRSGGAVTYGEAFTVQPFGNSLTTIRSPGAQLLDC